jgi:chemotaxis protein histidine kinase CheA
VTQEGNEVAVEFRDDGAGLDLARIRAARQDRACWPPMRRPTMPSWPT